MKYWTAELKLNIESIIHTSNLIHNNGNKHLPTNYHWRIGCQSRPEKTDYLSPSVHPLLVGICLCRNHFPRRWCLRHDWHSGPLLQGPVDARILSTGYGWRNGWLDQCLHCRSLLWKEGGTLHGDSSLADSQYVQLPLL